MQTELAFCSLKEEEMESHNGPKLIAPVFSSAFALQTVLIVCQVTLWGRMGNKNQGTKRGETEEINNSILLDTEGYRAVGGGRCLVFPPVLCSFNLSFHQTHYKERIVACRHRLLSV